MYCTIDVKQLPTTGWLWARTWFQKSVVVQSLQTHHTLIYYRPPKKTSPEQSLAVRNWFLTYRLLLVQFKILLTGNFPLVQNNGTGLVGYQEQPIPFKLKRGVVFTHIRKCTAALWLCRGILWREAFAISKKFGYQEQTHRSKY